MSLRGFFEGIQDFAEGVLFQPFYALTELELTNWWASNVVNWIFTLICVVAMVYWMKQLQIFNAEGTEDREAKAHGFLGKNSDLEHNL